MDVLPPLEKHVKVPETSSCTFAAGRVSYTGFSDTCEARHQRAPFRFRFQIPLDAYKHFVCSLTTEFVKSARK